MIYKKPRLYLIISIVMTAVVLLFMGIYSWFLYQEKQRSLQEDLKNDSHITLSSLKRDLLYFIEAYAVNDYELLIQNDMQHRNFTAIIVEDYKMAEVLGEQQFLTGSIRHEDGKIKALDPNSKKDLALLSECYYKQSTVIYTSPTQKIAKVTICSTDRYIQKELNTLLKQNVFISLLLSLILSALLFFVMRYFALSPISYINAMLAKRDKDNLPDQLLKEANSYEIELLSKNINQMIEAVHLFKEKETKNLLELDRERKRFQLAIEGTRDGIWDWDPISNKVFFSLQWKQMLGYEDEEILGDFSEWEKRVHPDDLQNALHAIKKHLQGKTEVYENKHRMLCKDGSWKWILDRGKALFDAQGNAIKFVGFHTDITESIEHQKALEYSATHDSLTQLPNRFLFNELIQRMLSRAERHRNKVALLYLDLDGFKEINDTFGHAAGDLVLITIAQNVRKLLRQADVIARLGGDEFVIALNDISRQQDLEMLLLRILKSVNTPVAFEKNNLIHQLQVSASIGVSTYPQKLELGPEALLRQADQAMYDAKSSGKNQYRFFNLDAIESDKLYQQTLNEFFHAIETDELVLYYQPKVHMQQGKVLGFEALLRWQHPTQGLLFPDQFLGKVSNHEEAMLALGQWVLKTAMKQLETWHKEGFELSLSVNISVYELKSEAFIDQITNLLQQHPSIKPAQLELEILETHALEDNMMAHHLIKKCQSLGLSIALDDFGTGYSTMSYLRDLPVNTLKIDKSFVMDMLHDSGSFSILEAAMGLASAFRCNTVAEGVESESHGVSLIELGCVIGQGYAIAKPIPAQSVTAWLKEWAPFSSWTQTKVANSKEFTMLMAAVEHRQWIKMIEAYTKDAEAPLPELNEKLCRFGQWLLNDAPLQLPSESLEKIHKLHDQIHSLGEEIIKQHKISKLQELQEIHLKLLTLLKLR